MCIACSNAGICLFLYLDECGHCLFTNKKSNGGSSPAVGQKVVNGIGFLTQSFQLHGEVAHQGSFPLDGNTAGDFVATVIHVLQGGGNHVHVVVGIDAACDAQAQQVEAAKAVLAGHGVTVGQDVADFTTADTSLQIELACQGLSGELFLGNVAQHLVGVDKQSVTANGTLRCSRPDRLPVRSGRGRSYHRR